jgi:hypothetical protein
MAQFGWIASDIDVFAGSRNGRSIDEPAVIFENEPIDHDD